MSQNIYYVSPEGQDTGAEIGNPNTKFSIQSAIRTIISDSSNSANLILLSDGDYILPCDQNLISSGMITFLGSSPKRVKISAATFQVMEDSIIQMVNVAISTCPSNNDNSAFVINGGNLTCTNCDISSFLPRLFDIDNGAVTFNNCNIYIRPPRVNTGIGPIDGTNGASSFYNTNIKIMFNEPIQINPTLMGLKPDTGFMNLNNVAIDVEFRGGVRNIYGFYNVNIVSNISLTVKNLDQNRFILITTDMSTADLVNANSNPIYLTDLCIKTDPQSMIYTDFNTTNYPVIYNNIIWNEGTVNPGPFIIRK